MPSIPAQIWAMPIRMYAMKKNVTMIVSGANDGKTEI
jgi:hypothetical protein